MSLSGPRHCYGCGRQGLTIDTCPNCRLCKYCKSKEHVVSDCPKVPPCPTCGKKGHKKERCRLPINSQSVFSSSIDRGSKPQKEHTSTSKHRKAKEIDIPERTDLLDIKSPQHDDPQWHAVGSSREIHQTQPLLKFPDLRVACLSLFQEILNIPTAHLNPSIHSFLNDYEGGFDALADSLLKHVEPSVRKLQGMEITPSVLTRTAQSAEQAFWSDEQGSLGYCDFVTDDRNPEYLRIYIGQTTRPKSRMIEQHLNSIVNGVHNTLHYFILWMGNGHRAANIFKLWSLPSDMDRNLHTELLEELFCRAFQSIHYQATSQEYREANATTGYGLNVMSPLLQNAPGTQFVRNAFVNYLLSSPDQQIRDWVGQRGKVYTREKKALLQPKWLGEHYLRALKDTIPDEAVFEQIAKNSSHKAQVETTEPGTPTIAGDIQYFGTLSANCGFVLDFPRVAAYLETADPALEAGVCLPWALSSMGFNDKNVLVWTYDFESFSKMDATRLGRYEPANTLQQHKAILDSSQLKVTLLCGTYAESAITSVIPYEQKYVLPLRGYRYNLYVSAQDSEDRRLFVSCPRLPVDIHTTTAENTAKLTEVIKFACLLTGLNQIKPYFVQSASAWIIIATQRALEKEGHQKVTADTMDDKLRVWLFHKGFTDIEDIRKLEERAGSLMFGLLALLSSLPRNPAKELRRSYSGSQKREKMQDDEIQKFKNARAFCAGIIQERERRFEQQRQGSTGGEVTKVAYPARSSGSNATSTHAGRQRTELPRPDASASKHELEGSDEGGTHKKAKTSREVVVERNLTSNPEVSEEQMMLQRALSEGDLTSCEEVTQGNLTVSVEVVAPTDEEAEEILHAEIADDEDEATTLILQQQHVEELQEILEVGDDNTGDLPMAFQGQSPTVDTLQKQANTMSEEETYDDFVDLIAELKQTAKMIVQKKPRNRRSGQARGLNWSKEAYLYLGKAYSFYLLPGDTREIVIGHCHLFVDSGADVGDGKVNVRIHTMDEAERHPRVWASDATDIDVGKRLAFELTWTNLQGQQVTKWPQAKGNKTLFRANSFADRLINKLTFKDLAKVERRFLYWAKGHAPPGYVGDKVYYTSPV